MTEHQKSDPKKRAKLQSTRPTIGLLTRKMTRTWVLLQLQMLLPTVEKLHQIQGVDIAGFMEPADEVGGDYYDVLQHNGQLKIGIGDVTGHGLESGIVMLMLQAVFVDLNICK